MIPERGLLRSWANSPVRIGEPTNNGKSFSKFFLRRCCAILADASGAHGRLAHDVRMRPIGPDTIPRRRLPRASPTGDARDRSAADAGHTNCPDVRTPRTPSSFSDARTRSEMHRTCSTNRPLVIVRPTPKKLCDSHLQPVNFNTPELHTVRYNVNSEPRGEALYQISRLLKEQVMCENDHEIVKPGVRHKGTSEKDRFEMWMRSYDGLTSTYLSCYKMYMQSWVICGAAILVGGIFAVAGDFSGQELLKPQNSRGPLETSVFVVLAPCFVPFVTLMWFLMTSYFWASFQLLEYRLADLEQKMRDDVPELESVCPSFFSSCHVPFFQTTQHGRSIDIVFLVFGTIVYSAFCWTASSFASQLADGPVKARLVFWAMLAMYVFSCAITMAVVIRFIKRAKAFGRVG
jgi:hypothetical protein